MHSIKDIITENQAMANIKGNGKLQLNDAIIYDGDLSHFTISHNSNIMIDNLNFAFDTIQSNYSTYKGDIMVFGNNSVNDRHQICNITYICTKNTTQSIDFALNDYGYTTYHRDILESLCKRHDNVFNMSALNDIFPRYTTFAVAKDHTFRITSDSAYWWTYKHVMSFNEWTLLKLPKYMSHQAYYENTVFNNKEKFGPLFSLIILDKPIILEDWYKYYIISKINDTTYIIDTDYYCTMTQHKHKCFNFYQNELMIRDNCVGIRYTT